MTTCPRSGSAKTSGATTRVSSGASGPWRWKRSETVTPDSAGAGHVTYHSTSDVDSPASDAAWNTDAERMSVLRYGTSVSILRADSARNSTPVVLVRNAVRMMERGSRTPPGSATCTTSWMPWWKRSCPVATDVQITGENVGWNVSSAKVRPRAASAARFGRRPAAIIGSSTSHVAPSNPKTNTRCPVSAAWSVSVSARGGTCTTDSGGRAATIAPAPQPMSATPIQKPVPAPAPGRSRNARARRTAIRKHAATIASVIAVPARSRGRTPERSRCTVTAWIAIRSHAGANSGNAGPSARTPDSAFAAIQAASATTA